MQWETPTYLWLLSLVPALLLLFWLGMWQRRRKLRQLGDESLLQEFMGGIVENLQQARLLIFG